MKKSGKKTKTKTKLKNKQTKNKQTHTCADESGDVKSRKMTGEVEQAAADGVVWESLSKHEGWGEAVL